MFDELNKSPINSWKYPRVLVGIPLERSISHADLVFNRFLEIAMQGPAICDIKYGRIDVVRNLMVKQLLESDFTHLLMLDIDHVHPADIVQRLAKWFIAFPEIKILSGLNFRRGAPFDPVAGVYEEGTHERKVLTNWPNGLFDVDEVGGASLMVDRCVFETLEPPWFFNLYDRVWENSWPGEDIGFSQKAREAGFKIYVDGTTSSPHVTDILVTEETFRAYQRTTNVRRA